MNFALDCPDALGTEFAFSTFTTCPPSVPKYRVEELVVYGDTVRAEIFEVKKVEFDIMFGKGISRSGEVLDAAVESDIITKSGSWFSYDDTKLGQGRDAVKQVISDNPELSEELEAKIKEISS